LLHGTLLHGTLLRGTLLHSNLLHGTLLHSTSPNVIQIGQKVYKMRTTFNLIPHVKHGLHCTDLLDGIT